MFLHLDEEMKDGSMVRNRHDSVLIENSHNQSLVRHTMASGNDILTSSADTYMRPSRVDIRDRAISVQTDQRQSLLLR